MQILIVLLLTLKLKMDRFYSHQVLKRIIRTCMQSRL
nr:MAG TPA: hypothetical protein [Bacteriophage sp.]